MKRFCALLLCLGFLLGLTACQLKTVEPFSFGMSGGRGKLVRGNGEAIERTVPLGDDARPVTLRVSGISFNLDSDISAVELVIDESLERAVKLTVDSNISEFISISYSAAEITVKMEEQRVLAPTQMRLVVGAPVGRLLLNGPWNFTYDCPGVEGCDISINGAASGDLAFGSLNRLEATLNGACNLKMRGSAKDAAFTLNGASKVEAFDLLAGAADVTINGASNCEITAVETLNAVINGVGSVIYGGSPAVRRSIHGLGEIRAR